MFVAGATREQKSFEGGLQRLEFKKITCEPHCQFPFSNDFLLQLHTPWWLILSVGSFWYSPLLLYMGSFSFSYTPCAGLCREHLLLVYMGTFSYMPSAGLRVEFLLHTPCWLLFLGVSLIMSMLASLCREFLLFKTKRKNIKVNKNVHN